MSVEVCTDLAGNEPHSQVGMGRVGTSGSLGDVMVSTLDENARDVGSIPALGTTKSQVLDVLIYLYFTQHCIGACRPEI